MGPSTGGDDQMTFKQLFLALSLALAFTATSQAANPAAVSDRIKCNKDSKISDSVTVDRVVDGDTVIVRVPEGTYSVRMLGIDTPETHFMGKSQGEWGEKASALLTQLLPVGTPVRLEMYEDACDAHGRLLAHVFAGKLHTNQEMVKQGLAVNYCVAPDFNYCREFADAVAAAVTNRTGMFADSNMELPYDFRRRIGGNEQRSFVGNLATKEVLRPGHQDEVTVSERVFFYRESDVKAPYHIVN
jgi:micrococcal nuclease